MNQKPGILNFVGITAIVVSALLIFINLIQLLGNLVYFIVLMRPAIFAGTGVPSEGLNAAMIVTDTVANLIDVVVCTGWIVAGYGAITAAGWTRTTANSFTALAIVTEPILNVLYAYFSHDFNNAMVASFGLGGIEAGEQSFSSAILSTCCSLPFLMLFPVFFLIQFNMKPFADALLSVNNPYGGGGQPPYDPYYTQQPQNPYGAPGQEPGGWYDQNAPVEPPSRDDPYDRK